MSSLGPIDRHLLLYEHCVILDSDSLALDTLIAAPGSELALASQHPSSNCRRTILHHLAKATIAEMHLVGYPTLQVPNSTANLDLPGLPKGSLVNCCLAIVLDCS